MENCKVISSSGRSYEFEGELLASRRSDDPRCPNHELYRTEDGHYVFYSNAPSDGNWGSGPQSFSVYEDAEELSEERPKIARKAGVEVPAKL